MAPDLLGLLLRQGERAGRIVEVEAYEGENDKASHAVNGPTQRNTSMFAEPGTLYVYLIYGIHLCANISCGRAGEGGAVLLRALEPVDGLDLMWESRTKAKTESDLCRGPGNLTKAMGIGAGDDGRLVIGPESGRVQIQPSTQSPELTNVAVGTRIGISKDVDRPWRFAELGNQCVSRPNPWR